MSGENKMDIKDQVKKLFEDEDKNVDDKKKKDDDLELLLDDENQGDMTDEDIKNETIASIKNMRNRVNEWSVRDTLIKFTEWGFYKGSVMVSIDETVAKNICNQLIRFIKNEAQKQDIQDAYELVYHYAPDHTTTIKEGDSSIEDDDAFDKCTSKCEKEYDECDSKSKSREEEDKCADTYNKCGECCEDNKEDDLDEAVERALKETKDPKAPRVMNIKWRRGGVLGPRASKIPEDIFKEFIDQGRDDSVILSWLSRKFRGIPVSFEWTTFKGSPIKEIRKSIQWSDGTIGGIKVEKGNKFIRDYPEAEDNEPYVVSDIMKNEHGVWIYDEAGNPYPFRTDYWSRDESGVLRYNEIDPKYRHLKIKEQFANISERSINEQLWKDGIWCPKEKINMSIKALQKEVDEYKEFNHGWSLEASVKQVMEDHGLAGDAIMKKLIYGFDDVEESFDRSRKIDEVRDDGSLEVNDVDDEKTQQKEERDEKHREDGDDKMNESNLKEEVKKLFEQYYAEFDNETGLWCVFNDDKKPGHAYSSYADEDEAKRDVAERNKMLAMNEQIEVTVPSSTDFYVAEPSPNEKSEILWRSASEMSDFIKQYISNNESLKRIFTYEIPRKAEVISSKLFDFLLSEMERS
jgi:hypothetical protein